MIGGCTGKFMESEPQKEAKVVCLVLSEASVFLVDTDECSDR